MAINKLNIINWNARSLRSNIVEFVNFLRNNNINIAIITETFLDSQAKIFIPGYNVIRKDRPNRKGGGVAIIVKNNIEYSHLPDLKLEIIESVGIQIFTNFGPITFYSVYMPVACTKKNNLENKFKNDIKKLASNLGNFCIIGDLNAKSRMWNNNRENTNGHILTNLLNKGKFTVQYSDTPTYLCKSTGTSSNLDICLTNITRFISKPQTILDLQSDHFPVLFCLEK